MKPATCDSHGRKELPPIPITISTAKRRRRLSGSGHAFSSSAASTILFGMVAVMVLTLIATASAFASRQSRSPSLAFGSPPGHTSFLPAVPNNKNSNSNGYELSYAKARGKIRPVRTSSTAPLFVSLEQSPSTVSDTDSEEQQTAKSHNATMPDLSNDLIKDTSEETTQEVLIPMGETEERHMERARMGDDVEEITHLLAHDQVDLQSLVSPSIPISYDAHGMVQADATPYSSAVTTNNGIVLESNNGALAIAANNEVDDYPPFIKFLFQKDDHGQTLASKLFNAALLAASFGYVISIVFNIDRGMTRGWTPTEIGMRIPLDTWASYENSLSEKPVATKTIINIVIYLLGDWLSQTLFQSKNILDFDAARTLKNGFVGMCFGPAVHEYYEFSDWILPVDGVTLGLTNRAFKILMDQTIYLSIKCSIYILAIGILSGDSLEDSSENVKNKIKPIMFTAWKFWPLVHCVTYGLIPARHRILWVNSVDLVWNAILASKARGDEDEEGSTDSEGGVEGLDIEEKIIEANVEGVNDGELDIFQKFGAMQSAMLQFDSVDDDEGGDDGHLNKTPKLASSEDDADNANADLKKTAITGTE